MGKIKMKIKLVLKKILPLYILNIYYFLKKIIYNTQRKIYHNIYPSYDTTCSIIEGLANKNNNEIKKTIIYNIGCKKIVNQLVNLYFLRKENMDDYNCEYKCFLIKILKINSKSKTYEKWQCLKIISICLGFFQLANIFRKKANEKLLNKKHITKKYALQTFNLLMENGDFARAEVALNIVLNHVSDYERNILLNYFSLYSKQERKEPKEKDEYQSYIKNKHTVILGPASDVKKIKKEISKDAVIIRNNYYGDTSDEKQLKTDISYYNTGRFEQLKKNSFFDEIHNIKFYCLKNCNAIDMINPRIKNQCHIEPQIYCLFNYSAPLMLPIMLLDLIFNNAKIIEVYGNTMYLSKITHGQNYISKDTEFNNIDYWYAFAFHGIIENFIFIQNLYNNGYFKTDSYFSTVLNMNIEEYLKEMELRWVLS